MSALYDLSQEHSIAARRSRYNTKAGRAVIEQSGLVLDRMYTIHNMTHCDRDCDECMTCSQGDRGQYRACLYYDTYARTY